MAMSIAMALQTTTRLERPPMMVVTSRPPDCCKRRSA
jgi:hypothetical protein